MAPVLGRSSASITLKDALMLSILLLLIAFAAPTPSSQISAGTAFHAVKTAAPAAGLDPAVTHRPSVVISSFNITPNPTLVGTLTTFTITTSGTVYGYITYFYGGLPPGCTTSNTSSFSCTPTSSGSFTIQAIVNDSKDINLDAVTLVVNPSNVLAITQFAADPNPVAVNHQVIIAVSTSGSSGVLSYNYTGLPAGCSNLNMSAFACDPTVSGSFPLKAFVNDSTKHFANATMTLVVNPTTVPTISNFVATPSSVSLGNATNFSVAVSGGTGYLVYTYTGLPTGCLSSNLSLLLCTPARSGSFVVRVFVNDTAMHSASQTTRLTVRASTHPKISEFSATPATITVGSTTTLTVVVSGGTGTLSYAYTGLPTGCSTKDLSSLSCTPTAAGTFTVKVFVNDSVKHAVNATTSLLVNPAIAPTISEFTSSPDSITLGSSTTFIVAAFGGSGTLSYAYAGLPGGCSTKNASTLACTPAAIGTFSARVYVNDTAKQSSNKTTTLTVNAPPLVITSFTASPNVAIVDTVVYLNVTASGGIAPLTPLSYTYTGLPAGCMTSSLASLPCTPAVTGKFIVRVFVNDSAKQSDNDSVALEVTSAPIATLTSVAVSPTTPTVASGGTIPFTASPKCSATCPSGITYLWALTSPLGTLNATIYSQVTFVAGSVQGTVGLFVNATLNGTTKGSSTVITITGTSAITLSGVNLAPTAASLSAGGSQSFVATPTCENGDGTSATCPSGITYAWSLSSNDGNITSTTGASNAFTAGNSKGIVDLKVIATLDRTTAQDVAAITITPSAQQPTSPGSSDSWAYVLLAVILAATVLILFLIVEQRRRSKQARTAGTYGRYGVGPQADGGGVPSHSNGELTTNGIADEDAFARPALPIASALPVASAGVDSNMDGEVKPQPTAEGLPPPKEVARPKSAEIVSPAPVKEHAPTPTSSPDKPPATKSQGPAVVGEVAHKEPEPTTVTPATEDQDDETKDEEIPPPLAFVPLSVRLGLNLFSRRKRQAKTSQIEVVPTEPEQASPESAEHGAEVAQADKEKESTQAPVSEPQGEKATTGQESDEKTDSKVIQPPKKCIVCGSNLEDEFCSVCEMHWDGRS